MVEAAARGTGLIVVAVVIGVVLLQLSDDNAQPVSAGGEAVEVDDDSKAGMTTTTVAPCRRPRPPWPWSEGPAEGDAAAKDVTVLVLNGSGRNKLAGPMAERLDAVGYRTLDPGNASLRDASIVLCRPDNADDAEPSGRRHRPEPLDRHPQDDDFPDAGDAHCVVIIGSQ